MYMLLEDNENRHFHFIKYLHHKNDWVKLPEIATALSCSERSLKYDLAYFKKDTSIFTIETSTKGVRVVFADNKNFKCFSASVLEQSLSYQLLEKIFFDEQYSVPDLAELLFVGSSTLYALINKINHQLIPYEIEIETKPCRITGNEINIRKFFYIYFYEKHTALELPYDPVLADITDKFITYLINYYDFTQANYIDFNMIRLVLRVNIYRYKHHHLLPNEIKAFKNHNISSDDSLHFQQVAKEILLDLDPEKIYLPYEITIPFLTNLLFPFHQVQIVNSYDSLVAEGLDNNGLAEEILFLNQKLEDLSQKYALPLNNRENIIYHLHNAVAMENFDPRSNHILFSSNTFFTQNIEERFPFFFEDIKSLIKDYLDLKKIEQDQDNINYLIYVLFIEWEQLYLHLENRFKEVRVVILSDSDISHAKMIKDMLESSFYSYLSIDYFSAPVLTEESLKTLKNYDFVIANFPVDAKYASNLIQTENIPTIMDMEKIENKMTEVLSKRSMIR